MVTGDKKMHLRPGDKQKIRVQGSPLGGCQSEKQSRRKRIVMGIFNEKLKEREMEFWGECNFQEMDQIAELNIQEWGFKSQKIL